MNGASKNRDLCCCCFVILKLLVWFFLYVSVSFCYFMYTYVYNFLNNFLTNFLTNFFDDLTNFFDEFFLTNFFDEFFWRIFLKNFFDEFLQWFLLSFNHCELLDRSTFDLVFLVHQRTSIYTSFSQFQKSRIYDISILGINDWKKCRWSKFRHTRVRLYVG